MTHHLSNASAASPSAVSAILLGDGAPSKPIAQRTAVLRQLSAKMVYLAEQARGLHLGSLEATLVRTAAEVLTSSSEIANAEYAPLLIQRLSLKIDQIEDDLRADFIDYAVAH